MTASLDPRLDAQSPLRLIIWVVGALSAVAILLTALSVLLDLQLKTIADDSSQMTVSLDTTAIDNASSIEDLTKNLSKIPGILTIRVMDNRELASGIEGSNETADLLLTLNLPTVLSLDYDTTSSPDLSKISQVIMAIDQDATIKDGATALTDRIGDSLLFQRLSLIAIAGCLLSLVAIVWIACRNALASHHGTLDLLRTMGAEDRDLAGQFEAKASAPIMWSVLIGSLLGLAASGLLLLSPIGHLALENNARALVNPVTAIMFLIVPAIMVSSLILTIKIVTKRYLRSMA